MNKVQWNAIGNRLKNRQVLLTAAVVISMLLLGLYFIRAVYPALAASNLDNGEIVLLEQQRAALEQKPVPDKVPDSEVTALLRRVPTQPEIPRFLYALLSAEEGTGVILQSYTTGTPAKNAEGQKSFIDTKTNSVQTQAGKPAVSPHGNGVTELTITLKLSGTYDGLQQFLARLQQGERLVSVTSWTLNAVNQSPVKPSQAQPKPQPQLQNQEEDGGTEGTPPETETTGTTASASSLPLHMMELQLSLYAAPSYEGKLGALEALPLPSHEARIDPTLSDHAFYPMLKPVP
ncbi:hypothetical protein WMW72_11865 [Paenibacillus filicis]|uniref:Pilus assembly protein PilO n=1 Tax=Paenibacillus filicis TaxID=669464 RepID=A0ABU9DIA8_9BACL